MIIFQFFAADILFSLYNFKKVIDLTLILNSLSVKKHKFHSVSVQSDFRRYALHYIHMAQTHTSFIFQPNAVISTLIDWCTDMASYISMATYTVPFNGVVTSFNF